MALHQENKWCFVICIHRKILRFACWIDNTDAFVKYLHEQGYEFIKVFEPVRTDDGLDHLTDEQMKEIIKLKKECIA